MKLKLRDILLMLLNASDDSKISGKTKIQKECYLLSIKIHKENDFQFQAYYYGPYSPAVDYALSELVGIGFVKENKSPWAVDSRGFEAVLYDFELTDEGKEMANIVKESDPETYKKIEDLVNSLKNLGNPNYMQLSAASKAHFILKKENKEMTTDEIKQKANDFGWNLTDSDIDKAVKILEKLCLISEAQSPQG